MHAEEWPSILQARLLDQRVVSIFGRLDAQAVSDAAAQLWTLDALGDAAVRLLFCVQGGSVADAAALLDVLDVVGVEVNLTCLGSLSGPPLAVLAGARVRVAAPSARFLLRDDEVELSGHYRDLASAARQLAQQRQQLLERLAGATGGRRGAEQVMADFESGLALGAEEAVGYGLVDRVEPGVERLVQLPRPAPTGLGLRPQRPQRPTSPRRPRH